MFNFSMPELGLVLVIALIVFGPGKLPEVGKALGKGLGELRRGLNSDPCQEPITIQANPIEKKDNEVQQAIKPMRGLSKKQQPSK
jgi:sec-independent protein translocase protein TatA